MPVTAKLPEEAFALLSTMPLVPPLALIAVNEKAPLVPPLRLTAVAFEVGDAHFADGQVGRGIGGQALRARARLDVQAADGSALPPIVIGPCTIGRVPPMLGRAIVPAGGVMPKMASKLSTGHALADQPLAGVERDAVGVGPAHTGRCADSRHPRHPPRRRS